MVNVGRSLPFLVLMIALIPFTRLVAGDPCPCDFAVNGVSILPDRRQRVDFSSPYFTANQGVLVRKGTAVTGVADARRLRFGVQEATSGAAYLEGVLKPTQPPRSFGSNGTLSQPVAR